MPVRSSTATSSLCCASVEARCVIAIRQAAPHAGRARNTTREENLPKQAPRRQACSAPHLARRSLPSCSPRLSQSQTARAFESASSSRATPSRPGPDPAPCSSPSPTAGAPWLRAGGSPTTMTGRRNRRKRSCSDAQAMPQRLGSSSREVITGTSVSTCGHLRRTERCFSHTGLIPTAREPHTSNS